MSQIKKIIMIILFYIFRIFPIDNKKIVVCNYLGKGYGDNGKYIINELLKRDSSFDIVWLVRNENEEFPRGVRTVKYNTLRSVYEQVTAKLWIDNRRKPGYVRKRSKQIYIMTWHAGIGLKRGEGAAIDALTENYISAAQNDSQMADLFLSNSTWTTNMYRKYFWYNGEILEKGLPREDILFQPQTNLKMKLAKVYGFESDCNIILYAPTFRKSRSVEELTLYTMEWKVLLNILENKTHSNWVGMIRLHPNISEQATMLQLPSNVINVSTYPDMQELLAVSDILITDYSSCMFDFGATGKPVFIYAPDLQAYKMDRNFLFRLEDLPFGVSENQENLRNCISHFDETSYKTKAKNFYNKCGLFKGGEASKYVVDYILEHMK